MRWKVLPNAIQYCILMNLKNAKKQVLVAKESIATNGVIMHLQLHLMYRPEVFAYFGLRAACRLDAAT